MRKALTGGALFALLALAVFRRRRKNSARRARNSGRFRKSTRCLTTRIAG